MSIIVWYCRGTGFNSRPWNRKTCFRFCFFSPVAQQTLMFEVLLIVEASRLHSDTPHSVGLLWTNDQADAETSTWQITTLTRDRHPCPSAGFEPTIPASERPQTHALDLAVTGIGWFWNSALNYTKTASFQIPSISLFTVLRLTVTTQDELFKTSIKFSSVLGVISFSYHELSGKTVRKRPFCRPGCRRENDIEQDLMEIWRIYPSKDRDQWRRVNVCVVSWLDGRPSASQALCST
jgi:hypothetical protein